MPVGKTIAECLQALGVLDKKLEAQTKKQWPQNAKDLNEAIVEFADSIERESDAHGIGESLNQWVEERATKWVRSNRKLWSAEHRLPHAPVFPKDEAIIIYWIQQYVLYKWYTSSRNRKAKETGSLPGLHFHGNASIQGPDSETFTAKPQVIEQVQTSGDGSESHDLDDWSPYTDAEADQPPSDSAAGPMPDTSSNLTQPISCAIVPYNGSDSHRSHTDDNSSRNESSNSPAANSFRSGKFAPVTFQAEIYSRITFLIGPSHDRNGHMSNSYARIMGLEEAQSAETFRAGVFERLGEMGEVVGSRKVVVKPD